MMLPRAAVLRHRHDRELHARLGRPMFEHDAFFLLPKELALAVFFI